jgi:hypothetical protein
LKASVFCFVAFTLLHRIAQLWAGLVGYTGTLGEDLLGIL